MAAVGRGDPCLTVRQSLVRLGHLCFEDFLLLHPAALISQFALRNSLLPDWSLALNNAPRVLLHLRRSDAALASSLCTLASGSVPALREIRAAQSRLVHAFAYELLRAKAPPLYDALPWHDWDFSIVARRFPIWKTRFLLAGDGTTVTVCRCRKSAGVYALEPNPTMARYLERKAVTEKVRRFRLLRSGASIPDALSLTPVPPPDHSVDLAIIGSIPSLDAGDWRLVIQELLRVSLNVLLVENNPLSAALPEALVVDAGFHAALVEIRGLGQRKCWWHTSAPRPPA